MSPGGSKIDSQRPLGSCWRLFGVQVEFGANFGAIWRPNLGPCWGQVGTKIASTFEHKSDTCLDRNFQPCWTDFRPKLAPFLNDFRIDFTPPCKDAETAKIAFSSRGKQQQKATTSRCSETYENPNSPSSCGFFDTSKGEKQGQKQTRADAKKRLENEAKRGSNCVKNAENSGLKSNFRSKSVLEASWERFWEDFDPMLDTKSVQKRVRNTAKILNDF